MKKFIVAFDSLDFSESALLFALDLAQRAQAHLVGVFLEDVTRHNFGLSELRNYRGNSLETYIDSLQKKDEEDRDNAIKRFTDACVNASVIHSLHRDRNLATRELVHESVYADLLILSAREDMSRKAAELPSSFLREILQEAECPLILVPEHFAPVDKVVLLYDGEPASVNAIRQYSVLFASSLVADVEVVTVDDRHATGILPDKRLIREFVERHFPGIRYVMLKGSAEDELIQYLDAEKKQSLVVLGAYKRSKISRLFKPSMADHLLTQAKFPLFIAGRGA